MLLILNFAVLKSCLSEPVLTILHNFIKCDSQLINVASLLLIYNLGADLNTAPPLNFQTGFYRFGFFYST